MKNRNTDEFAYDVYSVNPVGSAHDFSTNDYIKAKQHCDENANEDSDYVIYDSNRMVIYDTFSESLGDDGIMGT